MSGVYNIPLILAVTIMMIASGIIISKTNIVIPLQVVGAAVGTIGSGLLYTLNVNTGLGKWIGFQIFGGIGWGLAFQIPIIVAQSNATPEDMSPVTAMILRKCTHSFGQSNILTTSRLVFQNLGATAFISAGQAAFVNTLIQTLPATAPSVDVEKVIVTGATQIHTAFAAGQVPGIIQAYMEGVKVALALPIAGNGIAFILSLYIFFSKRRTPKTKTLKGTGETV